MNHTHEHAHDHGLQHCGHARHGDDRQPAGAHSRSDRHAGGETPKAASGEIVYTCPMHPEIRQPGPGNCPICGMALEPLAPAASVENPELQNMSRRFRVALALTGPLLLLMVGPLLGLDVRAAIDRGATAAGLPHLLV